VFGSVRATGKCNQLLASIGQTFRERDDVTNCPWYNRHSHYAICTYLPTADVSVMWLDRQTGGQGHSSELGGGGGWLVDWLADGWIDGLIVR
jgi:hypothetical protein